MVDRLSRPGAAFGEVAELVRGIKGRELLEQGNFDAGLLWAGQSQALVHDIPTVKALIDRIIGDARDIIGARLAGLLAA